MTEKLTLKQYRLIRDLTQEQMAEIIGVHINTYRNWEESPGKISIDKAKKIAQALSISVNEVFFIN